MGHSGTESEAMQILAFILVSITAVVLCGFTVVCCLGSVEMPTKMTTHHSMILGGDGCEDFGDWSEIASPFEGERCFQFRTGSAAGMVCKPSNDVHLRNCATQIQP